jgi:putative ABC transport system permease protein
VSADAPPDSPIVQAGPDTGPRRPAGRASADVEPGSTIVQAPSPAGGGMRRHRASADAHARSSTFEAAVGTGPGAPAVRRSADTRSGTSAAAPAGPTAGPAVRAVVRGIWRDYARQQGALLMDRADWLRLTGDARVSGLAVWLAPGSSAAGVAAALARAAPADAPVEIATSGQLRATSLRIFDRSFAVTRWLQGVALAIGLAGIAASFSAQVLARRREFGTLQHLGFTRRQVLSLVALEGALWSAVGAVLGVVLGLAVSVVLVKIVNPQSFHWTMQMSVPTPTLAALWLGVVAAGALTAWGSGHAAAGRDMVRAVKEDW